MESEAADVKEMKSAGMSRNYFCVDCKSTTRNPRLYLEHRRDFHNESILIHECELCVYASRHSQKLARHLRTVHRDVVQSIAVQSVSSCDSNKSYESIPDSLSGSLPVGKNTRLSICKLCGLQTINKTMLMEHVRTQHTDVRIYECDQCDYSHYIRDRYNRHHRYHSMNQIQCNLCEFQTIYRWNLERHMRHHIDSISMGFRCNKCNFTASTKQSITAHEIAHHSGLHVKTNLPVKTEDVQLNELPNISIKREITQEDENEEERNVTEKVDENQVNEEQDFDASAFLEVVMDDEPKSNIESNRSLDLDGKQETSQQRFEQPNSLGTQFKYFFCVKCNFRNEIKWNEARGAELPALCPSISSSGTSSLAPNSLYRCGYCHQTSNWKHVIERHCRLVHNTISFIEKYSVQEESFKTFTSNKRQMASSTDTVVAMKKIFQNMIANEFVCNDVKPPNEPPNFCQNRK